jgi:hypothetical protein
MLMVIFGAGASYDSVALTDEELVRRGLRRPPLAQGLVSQDFDELAVRIRECLPIVALLRRKLGAQDPQSLELQLAHIAARAPRSIEIRRQLIAFRLHLWQLIQEVVDHRWVQANHELTHYVDLLNYLLEWQQATGERVLLATFNYDQLLDMTARSVVTGWDLNSLDSYVTRPDFRLFKLHGSTAWSRPLSDPAWMSGQYSDAWRLLIATAMDLDTALGEIIASPPGPGIGPNGEVRFPAMAIPLEGKTAFECPDHHLRILKEDLPEVTHVLLIGWRAAEPHAVKLLEGLSDGYRLGIVTKGDDGWNDLVANLGAVYEKAEVRIAEKRGFTAHIATMEVELTDLLGPIPST